MFDGKEWNYGQSQDHIRFLIGGTYGLPKLLEKVDSAQVGSCHANSFPKPVNKLIGLRCPLK